MSGTRAGRGAPRLVASFLSFAMILGACGGSDASDSASGNGSDEAACPVDALEQAEGPVEITIWHSFIALQKRTLETIVEDYNASQDQVVVTAESQGVTPTELHRKIDQAAPDQSLPAIVVPDDTKTRYVADSGQFLPAQACFEADPEGQAILDDFLPIAPASYTIDGKLWPASFSTLTALIYLNREHFSAAGLDPDSPPETIEQMIDASRAIKAAGIEGVTSPMVMKAQAFIMEWWLSGARQELVNEENGRSGTWATESRFDNPVTRDILTTLQEAKNEGLLDVTSGAEGNVDQLLAIASKQSSFTVDSSGAASTVAGVIEGTIAAEDIEEELGVEIPPGLQLDLDVSTGAFPGVDAAGKGQVGGQVWYMSNTVPDEQQSAAWDFMKFLNTVDSQVRWGVDASIAPVSKAAGESPELQEAWSSTLAGEWEKVAYDVLSGIDTEFPGPVIGPYDEVRRAIEKCLDRVFLDGDPVGEAVEEADATITAALERYNQDVDAG